MRKLLLVFLSVFAFTVSAFAAPTRQDLDQEAKSYLTSYAGKFENFGMGFLTKAVSKTYYSISRYHTYESGTIEPRILGIFNVQDEFNRPLTFGILFRPEGKALQLVGTIPNNETCIPYHIHDASSYTVYYTAKDRSSLKSLAETRTRVTLALSEVLLENKLMTGREQLEMRINPNSDRFEPQDYFQVKSGKQLRQKQINEAFSAVKIEGVDRAFIGNSRVGNPVMDPFNTSGNAVCSEIRE